MGKPAELLAGTKITVREAIAEALRMEMHRDSSVVLFSASPGGIAEDLAQEFGPERVIATETVGAPIVLSAAGAAVEGLRPVCELGPADGGAPALDQLAELASVEASRARGSAPLTVRLACGDPLAGGGAAGADPLAWLAGTAGLTIATAATPADAKGLTAAAVRDDAPVCLLEDARILEQLDFVPEGAHVVELGRARLAREGQRMTLVSHGWPVPVAERAVAAAELDADVLDLRTLHPLDHGGVLTSIRKTGRVLIVEPSAASRRVTAELVAAIWEQAFEYLDAPPRRVRLRYGGELHNGGSGAEAIIEACDELLSY